MVLEREGRKVNSNGKLNDVEKRLCVIINWKSIDSIQRKGGKLGRDGFRVRKVRISVKEEQYRGKGGQR